MINQISLFDILPQEEINYPDWHNMTEEQIAKFIGEQLGLIFVPDGQDFGYKATRNKIGEIRVQVSQYAVDLDKDGQPYITKGQAYIGVDYWNKKTLGGCGIPCDSLEEAINCIKSAEKRAEQELAYREERKSRITPETETEEEPEEDMEI